jgi:phospholipase C
LYVLVPCDKTISVKKSDLFKHVVSYTIIVFVVLSLVSSCSPVFIQLDQRGAEASAARAVPVFDHIVVITFENKEYRKIVNNPYMPTFNMYARDYTLLTQFYAVTHPSLPNYLAMIGGDTFNIKRNCQDCFINATSLPDLIEASGRTWKTYQEDMDTPCGLGSQDDGEYEQKHNPFVYFDAIRLDKKRCETSVVPLENLESDIKAGSLPNFIFITPNMCNNAHDCKLIVTDAWILEWLNKLIPALEKQSKNYLIVLNWDEGQNNGSCCGLPTRGGGRIAVVLISPLVKNHYKDDTPYSHYSLLKTVAASWSLPYLGHAADETTPVILAPWK